ncbi:MAG: fimbrillin family protein [Bacteroidales bacterium]
MYGIKKELMWHWNNYIKNCLFGLVIILVSCNRDNVVEEGDDHAPLQIGNISFLGVKRSTSELLTGNIGVFQLENTKYLRSRNNIQYTNSGSGWDVALGMEPIYLTKNEASLCAYSPYNSDKDYTDGSLTLTSQLYTESADLCYQTGVKAVSGTVVPFTLDHAYAKLTFTLTHNATYIDSCAVSEISIVNDGILASNTLDMTKGIYGSGTAGTVTVNPDISSITRGSSAEVTVLMVPVLTLSGDIALTFTVDDRIIRTTVGLNSLEAGSNYKVNIMINSSVSEVTTTANCYIIASGRSLNVPVDVRGNGEDVAGTGLETSISPLSVGLLWEDTQGLISLGDMSSDKKVIITANSRSTTGNAVIAAYSDVNQQGDILWSWHIWVTNYDPDVPFNGTTYLVTNSADSSYTFMDRNLGATTVTPGEVTTYGLYYQWGRKDPFKTEGTVTTADASSLSNSILNPSTFYIEASGVRYDWCTTPNDAFWGGAFISSPTEKTIFDPCPAGWRVPAWNGSVSPWSEFTAMNFIWSDTNHGGTYSDGAFYPAAGFRSNSSGALRDLGCRGNYWSGSPNGSYGYNLFFLNGIVIPNDGDYRANGYSVRCVKE